MLRPGRTMRDVSTILLPFMESGEVDWLARDAHVRRTARAGLTPAVNMDMGFVNLLDEATMRAVFTVRAVLLRTQSV